MLMVAVAVLIFVAVVLLGGDLRLLGQLQFRAVWLLFAALLLQILVISIVPDSDWLPVQQIHNGTYLMAAVFLALNWRIPGMLVLAVGAACNGITILLNDGTLPARAAALQKAGIAQSEGEFVNSGVVPDPALGFLGDIFYVPAGWPFANVFSIGDVLIWIGIAIAVGRVCLPDGPRIPFRKRSVAS